VSSPGPNNLLSAQDGSPENPHACKANFITRN
jgi:hypothetical protein